MKQYHYSDGINSYGPITLEELRGKNINPDTLIWTETMVTWTKAKEIPELQDLFVAISSPPDIPFSSQGPQNSQSSFGNTDPNYQRPPKTYLIEAILTTIFCCFPLGIPAIIYASRVEKKFYMGDYIGAEQDSQSAKKWTLINLGVCVLGWLAYIAIFGIAFLSSF